MAWVHLCPIDVPYKQNGLELIDAIELVARWRVRESWIRDHTRARTPKNERIPCIRLAAMCDLSDSPDQAAIP
jgi:hypothetical protein